MEVYLGSNVKGDGNIMLGYYSGALETGSNKLYIDNSNTTSPLIWGDFSNNFINFNASVGIGTSSPSYKLDIQGSSSVTSNIQSSGSGAYLIGSSPSGQEASLNFKTYSSGTNLSRWTFGKTSITESGSNVGSDLFINRYNDAGTYLGQPLSINRENGTVLIGNAGVSLSEPTIKIMGSISVKYMTISTNSNTTTLDGNDYTIIYTGTTTGNICNLPSASSYPGGVYVIINHSTASVTTSSYYISNSGTLSAVSAGSVTQLISDGISWRKMN